MLKDTYFIITKKILSKVSLLSKLILQSACKKSNHFVILLRVKTDFHKNKSFLEIIVIMIEFLAFLKWLMNEIFYLLNQAYHHYIDLLHPIKEKYSLEIRQQHLAKNASQPASKKRHYIIVTTRNFYLNCIHLMAQFISKNCIFNDVIFIFRFEGGWGVRTSVFNRQENHLNSFIRSKIWCFIIPAIKVFQSRARPLVLRQLLIVIYQKLKKKISSYENTIQEFEILIWIPMFLPSLLRFALGGC